MATEQNREAALSKLLTEMFDGDGAGLLRWVRLHLGKRIHDELATAPLSQLASDTTLAIQRHGLASQAFANLCEERPAQAQRIQEVADLWGVMVDTRVVGEPTTSGSTPTMARPWHVPDLPPHDQVRQALRSRARIR